MTTFPSSLVAQTSGRREVPQLGCWQEREERETGLVLDAPQPCCFGSPRACALCQHRSLCHSGGAADDAGARREKSGSTEDALTALLETVDFMTRVVAVIHIT